MRSSSTIHAVQTPIIPTVGEWTRNNPGTLSLGQGMVAYPPPPEALAAIRAFGTQPGEHYYGPSLGDPQLLALLQQKLLQDNALDVNKGYRVLVTAGANMAFLNVLLAILDPGDEVILPLPYYFNQEMAVRMLNGVPVTVPTDERYQLQLDALKAAITPKTRAIVTVSPNNPSGAVYPEDDLRPESRSFLLKIFSGILLEKIGKNLTRRFILLRKPQFALDQYRPRPNKGIANIAPMA